MSIVQVHCKVYTNIVSILLAIPHAFVIDDLRNDHTGALEAILDDSWRPMVRRSIPTTCAAKEASPDAILSA